LGRTENARQFHFIREIASGGFGRVFLAKVIHRDGFARLVAIKLLHKKWTQNDEIASRMRDEARLLGWLRHKNIVDVMDLTSIDGRCAVIMEYLEAVDLAIVISASAHSERRVPLRVALESIAAVASALDAAYNRPPYSTEKPLRVIHRDIKPSNIMIDDQGMVKVLDFGVARAEFDQRESKTKDLAFGSMEYMSPERLFFEPETPASDVYSLGVTLFEILALKKFGKAKLRAAAHAAHVANRIEYLESCFPMPSGDIGREVRGMLEGMLAFDAKQRPSAADCMTRLRALARSLRQLGLEEWSSAVIPPLLKQVQRRQAQRGSTSDLLDNTLGEDEGTAAFRRAGVNARPESGTDSSELSPSTTIPTTLKRAGGSARFADSEALSPPESLDVPRPGLVVDEKGEVSEPSAPPAPASNSPASAAPREPGNGLRTQLLIVLLGLLTGALAMFVGVLLIGGLVVMLVFYEQVAQPPPGTPQVAPAPSPVVAAAPIGPHSQFISMLPGTKKVSVRCEGGKGSGVMEATVPGESAGACTVTAIYDGRKRITAMLKDVRPVRYKCFRDGQKDCVEVRP
jgi:serine/threonine protein kinase